jgi:hypothetical protein
LEDLLQALQGGALAETLRLSVWLYPAVNALHILGIALLVGGILPLDLRRLGVWPGVPLPALERVLTRSAAAGLGLAVTTGALLFSVSATDYAALDVFALKMAVVALGLANALWARQRVRRGRPVAGFALVSLCAWLAALGLGRAIGYLM